MDIEKERFEKCYKFCFKKTKNRRKLSDLHAGERTETRTIYTLDTWSNLLLKVICKSAFVDLAEYSNVCLKL